MVFPTAATAAADRGETSRWDKIKGTEETSEALVRAIYSFDLLLLNCIAFPTHVVC